MKKKVMSAVLAAAMGVGIYHFNYYVSRWNFYNKKCKK